MCIPQHHLSENLKNVFGKCSKPYKFVFNNIINFFLETYNTKGMQNITLRYSGGFLKTPTPGGVPVRMTSPGRRVKNCVSQAINSSVLKISCRVLESFFVFKKKKYLSNYYLRISKIHYSEIFRFIETCCIQFTCLVSPLTTHFKLRLCGSGISSRVTKAGPTNIERKTKKIGIFV